MNYRLQFTHHSEVFESRDKALEYISKLYNPDYTGYVDAAYAEPYVVQYIDENIKNGEPQIILAIGRNDECSAVTKDAKYHIIDSANIEQGLEELSASTIELSAATVEIKELVDAIQEELDRVEASAGFDEDGNYIKHTILDETTYINSANTLDEADVALDKALKKLSDETVKGIDFNTKVDWFDGYGVSAVVENNIAYLEVTTDNIPFPKDYEGTLAHHEHSITAFAKEVEDAFSGLTIVKIDNELPSNVKEAYELRDKDNNRKGERINIYKDSALKDVYLGNMDDQIDIETGEITYAETGDPALCFVYYLSTGVYKLAKINISKFLEEAEFHDGLVVENHIVKVRVAEDSEPFLTSNWDEGAKKGNIKLAGIQDAIDAAKEEAIEHSDDNFNTASGLVATEEARAIAREDELQADIEAEVLARQNVTGQEGPEYKAHDSITDPVNYIQNATSMDDADVILDKALGELSGIVEDNRATLDEKIVELSGIVEDNKTVAHNELITASGEIETTINELSAGTIAEITSNAVHSEDNTIIVTKRIEGTDLSVNIDKKTVVEKDGVIGTGLKLRKVTPTEPDVREEFILANINGEELAGEHIKIYNDTSDLYNVYLGHVDDTLADPTNPTSIVPGTGHAALCFIYKKADGTYVLIPVDIEQYLAEVEFKDGLKVIDHCVYVVMEEHSEPYLTVTPNGLYLTGINDAIANASANTLEEAKTYTDEKYLAASGLVYTEEVRAKEVENALSGLVYNEQVRAENAENVLSGLVYTEEVRAKDAEDALSNRISDLEAETIEGVDAIAINGDANKVVSLVISEDDQILKQNALGLRAYISADYDNEVHKIFIYGKDGIVLSTIDCADFIKDGMIESVSFDPDTKKLTIVWNTASGKETTVIDLSSLVDYYTVSAGSETYLAIENFKVGAKVNVENGLAGYNYMMLLSGSVVNEIARSTQEDTALNAKLDGEIARAKVAEGELTNNLSAEIIRAKDAENVLTNNLANEVTRATSVEEDLNNAIETLNGGLNTAGSVKHTIDDSLVKFKREGSRVESDGTLMRYYMDGDDAKYYVSNKTSDMVHKGENLETIIDSISGSGEDTKEKLAELSATTVILEAGLASATTRIETLETELAAVSGQLETLLNTFDDKVYECVKNMLKGAAYELQTMPNDENKTITLGFADNAVFGPISLS